MDKTPTPRPGATGHSDHDDLHALVDGRLSPAEAQELQQRLAASPDDAETVRAWKAQREAIRQAFASPALETIPAPLLAAAREAQDLRNASRRWTQWSGIAASVLLAFALGWVGNQRFGGAGQHPGVAQSAQQFARQAAIAHVVFQPEVRHPVEVEAAQQQHLVQWLSKRLGRPLKVPLLKEQGWDLMGGRLLPGEDGARAQFMYQNASGQRLTLYVGAVKPGTGANTQETAFRFLDDGPVPGFYWVDQGFGYALSGQLPRPVLQDIAKAVYAQIG